MLVLAGDVDQAPHSRPSMPTVQGAVDVDPPAARGTTRRTSSSASRRGGPRGEPAAPGGGAPGPRSSKRASTVASSAPLAHHLGARAAAEHQVQGIHEDRLAGPGLAGEDVQAGAERTSTSSTTANPGMRSVVSMAGVCHRPLTLRKFQVPTRSVPDPGGAPARAG